MRLFPNEATIRVQNCCIGWTLRTGTRLILWLDLVYQIALTMELIFRFHNSQLEFTFFDAALLTQQCITFVAIIFGIRAVQNHQPSSLVPYMVMYGLGLVLTVFGNIILWIGPVDLRLHVFRYFTYKALALSPETDAQMNFHDFWEHEGAYHALLAVMSVLLFPIFYLLCSYFRVIYSYYKQMQEEDESSSLPYTIFDNPRDRRNRTRS